MKRFFHLGDVTGDDRGASVAIGNFDGVHLGHRAVLAAARASAPDAPLAVLTFEPHPRQVLQPSAPPFRLTSPDAKAHRLEKMGVDLLYELSFDTVRPMTCDRFEREILVSGLGVTHCTVGADFRYGAGRTGDVATLRTGAESHGYGVTIADLVSPEPGAPRVSSTAIRTSLTEGHPEKAAEMLGHWHRIEGPVLHGDKRGRDLGFPTANMSLAALHPPRFGVYAVLVDVLDGPQQGTYHGATSIGTRPQFGVNVPNLETYIFDFSGDLYGASLSVALVAFLRPEARFDSVDALVSQMGSDCDQARDILTKLS